VKSLAGGVGSNPSRKPVAAVTANVALNFPKTSLPFAVFAVSLAAAHGAGYFGSFRIARKKVL